MTTREKIIIGLMCVTIVYGAVELIRGQSGGETPARNQTNPTEELNRFVAEISQKMSSSKMGKEYQYMTEQAGAAWTKDPFIGSVAPLKGESETAVSKQPQTGVEQSVEAFEFTGFLRLGKKKLAVINGIEYEIGETLRDGGYYLLDATPEKAVIATVNGTRKIQVPLDEAY